MDDFRSKSCRDGRNMQVERYHNGEERPNGVHEFRSYSTNHAPAYVMSSVNEVEIKKVKKTGSFGSTGKSWSFNDAELKRKTRVVGYRVYSVEGRVKGSLRKSFSWIKDLVHGWR